MQNILRRNKISRGPNGFPLIFINIHGVLSTKKAKTSLPRFLGWGKAVCSCFVPSRLLITFHFYLSHKKKGPVLLLTR